MSLWCLWCLCLPNVCLSISWLSREQFMIGFQLYEACTMYDLETTTLVLKKDIVTLQEDTPHRSLFLQQNPYDCKNNATCKHIQRALFRSCFSQPHRIDSSVTIPDQKSHGLTGAVECSYTTWVFQAVETPWLQYNPWALIPCYMGENGWLLESMSIHWNMAIAWPLLLLGSLMIHPSFSHLFWILRSLSCLIVNSLKFPTIVSVTCHFIVLNHQPKDLILCGKAHNILHLRCCQGQNSGQAKRLELRKQTNHFPPKEESVGLCCLQRNFKRQIPYIYIHIHRYKYICIYIYTYT